MFPGNHRYFFAKMSEEDCWATRKLCRFFLGDTQFSTEDVFASPHVHPSSSYTWIPTPWNNPDTGRVPERTSTGQFAPEDGDGGKGAIPNPRCPRSSMTGNSLDAMEDRKYGELWG